MISWIFLIIAGLAEIGWAVSLKLSDGFSNIPIFISSLVFIVLNSLFFSLAVKHISMGTAYIICMGLGAIGVTLIGIIFFGESKDFVRIFLMTVIALGIIGLNLNS